MAPGPADEHLRAALAAESCRTKLHRFGHSHDFSIDADERPWSLHGHEYPGRCSVNASSVTSLYLPTQRPLVFDMPCGLAPAAEEEAER